MQSLFSVKGFFYLCVVFVATFTFSKTVSGSIDHGFGKRESRTTFVEHFHYVLNVEPERSITTYDNLVCALECLKQTLCISFNFAAHSRNNSCELLREDKYTFSDRFQPSHFYNHYSITVRIQQNIAPLHHFCLFMIFEILSTIFNSLIPQVQFTSKYQEQNVVTSTMCCFHLFAFPPCLLSIIINVSFFTFNFQYYLNYHRARVNTVLVKTEQLVIHSTDPMVSFANGALGTLNKVTLMLKSAKILKF